MTNNTPKINDLDIDEIKTQSLKERYNKIRKSYLRKSKKIEKKTGKRPFVPAIPKTITMGSIRNIQKHLDKISIINDYYKSRELYIERVNSYENKTGKKQKITPIPKRITSKSKNKLDNRSKALWKKLNADLLPKKPKPPKKYTYNGKFAKNKDVETPPSQNPPTPPTYSPPTPDRNFYDNGEGSDYTPSTDIIDEANVVLEDMLYEAEKYVGFSFEEWADLFPNRYLNPSNPYDAEFVQYKTNTAEDLMVVLDTTIPIDKEERARYVQDHAVEMRECFDKAIYDSSYMGTEDGKNTFQELFRNMPIAEYDASKIYSPEDHTEYSDMFSINDSNLEDFDF